MKKLELRKMGMDFTKELPSDVGNYRVRAEFTDKNGVLVIADFCGYERKEVYTKKNGKQGIKTVNSNALLIDGDYRDENGCWLYHPETCGVNIADYDFTKEDILRFMQDVTGDQYKEIIFC